MKERENINESSDEEDPVPDFDICDENELNRLFRPIETPYEVQVGKLEYVLHLATSIGTKNRLVCGTSEGRVQIYDVNQTGLSQISPIKALEIQEGLLSGLKFDSGNENVLYVTRTSGICTSFDLRANQIIHEYHDDSSGSPKTFTCMDVNQNSRLLCCGTDKIKGDAFLLFFDTRQRKLLGGYWESHEDDITDIKFHPNDPDSVASCSTDGLLNVYDLKHATEDDALLVSFNTENSASKTYWYRSNDSDHLACLTDTNDLQLYNLGTQDKIQEFTRETITQQMKRNSHIDCFLVGCYVTTEDDVYLLSTSNFNKGECLRSLKVTNESLEPSLNFVRASQVFRCCEYNPKTRQLFTGGEDGRVQLWNIDESTLPSDVQSLKEKSKLGEKIHKKVKPY